MSLTEIQQRLQPVSDELADAPIGYKRNDIGVIPLDWSVAALSLLATVKTGPFGSTLHERDYVDDGTPIITVEHLSEHGIIHKNLPLISDADRSRLKSYGLRVGDIVFSRVGSVDRNSLVNEEENGWLFSGRLLRVRTSDSTTYPPYLSYYFHSEPFKKRVRGVAVGQTMASLNTQILKGVCVVLPTLPEQRAIAEALSDVDGLLGALEALIAKKRAIKQAAMQQLLTGKTRLPGFSGKWKTIRLGDIAHIHTGNRNNQDKVEEGQYPFFVRSATVERINTYSFEGEAILIPGEGGIGSIFHYIDGRFDVHQRVYKICRFSEDVCGKCVYYSMALHFGSHAMNNTMKAAVDSLRLPAFKNFRFLLSENITEQRSIATVLSDIDAEIAALVCRRDKTRAIKQGMMQQLLTGRVRLVKPSLTEASA